MKKILMLLLALVLVFSLSALVACNNEGQGDTETESQSETEKQTDAETTTEEQTTAPSEETTEAESTTDAETTTEAESTTETDEEETTGEGEEEPSDLESAAEYVRLMYKDTVTTGADYTLITSVSIGGVNFPITWSVNNDQIVITLNEDGSKANVDVPDEAYEEIAYVLSATLTDAEGNTVVKEFERTVPKFAVTSWADYMKAEQDDNVVVQGIVVAINSKSAGNTRNHLFIMDESGCGGYYSYQMDADPVTDLGIEVGMTVRVTGPVSPYNGMQEIKGGIAQVLDTNIKEFAPVDITEQWVEGTDFNQFVSLPVVIKGVTIGGQELEKDTSQYLFFELNGVQGYVRTYVTDFPTTLKAEEKGTIDAAHAEKYGYLADVTGILITYSGTPYLIPTSVDCFYNYTLPERSDAEKVALEKDALTFVDTVTEGCELELPTAGTTYPEAVISWTSDSEYAVVDGSKLTVTIPNETTAVKLTATVTVGEVSESVEFELTLVATNFTIIPTTTPEEGVAYKFYMNQVNNGYGVFVSGGINQDRYLVTSKNVSEALDVYVEANGDGFSFYTNIDGAKKYINITHNEAGKTAVLYQDEAISVYTYNAEINAWVAALEGDENLYYLGSYNNFDTISASKTSYINAGNTGVSQFPLQIVALGDPNVSDDGNVITNAGIEIKEGVAYLMSMNQVNNGHVVYVCGGIDQDRYLLTSEDAAAALQVFVEKNGDGYNFYTTIDGAKKYINVTTNDAGKTAVLYEDAATSVYTYVSETNIWMTVLNGKDKYLGSYSKFDTISASDTSYINAGNTGVEQFPMELVVAE